MGKLNSKENSRNTNFQEHCIFLADGTKVKRYLSKDCVNCDPLNLEGFDGEYFTDELGTIIAAPDLTGAVCCSDVKEYTSVECLCDFIDDTNVVMFKRLKCFNFHTRQTTQIDRTLDLMDEYNPQGDVECCDDNEASLTTLAFCDSGTTFYRTFDVLTGTIIRQYDANMQPYQTTGQVTVGQCISQSSEDCCEVSIEQGVVTDW